MILALLPALALADCTFRASAADLDRALGAAEAAYVSLDVAEFERASTELDFVVPCLDQPVTGALAARLHRLRGLGRFAEGDRDGAVQSMLAARTLEPDYVFPEDVLPAGFELRTVYEGLAPPAEEPTARLPRPSHGALWFDGAEARRRPLDRPALFQLTDDGGVVLETQYLRPDQAVPRYPGVAKKRTALFVSAAATGTASALFYGLAMSSRADTLAPPRDWTNRDLVGSQRRTNALGGVAVGLAALTLAELGVAATWEAP